MIQKERRWTAVTSQQQKQIFRNSARSVSTFDDLKQILRDSQTELLKAFYDYAAVE